LPTHTYKYRAVDASGAVHAGELASASRAAALEVLGRQGFIPVELNESTGVVISSEPAVESKVSWLTSLLVRRTQTKASSRELLALTQSIASLLSAGLTVDRALQISATLAPRSVGRLLAERLLEGVRAGKTLNASFAASGQNLPPYYVSMVDAGESGGSLPQTMTRLAELMRRQLEVRERIRSALVYPSLLAGVVLFTLVMLLAFVLPRFESLFAESEVPLPLSTRAVLSVGSFVANYWWMLLTLAVAGTAGVMAWLRTPIGRYRFHRWLLRARVTLGLPAAMDTARLLRTVSTLCRNGTPLPSALRVARGTLTNLCLLDALGQVLRDVQAGEPVSLSLGRASVFPPVAVQLARVGEETGRLDEMLLSAAAVLEEESQVRLERLLTLIVPALTITMGLLVAGLIGSVLIGLLSINDLAF
jgi:general secretion pathway protein F